MAQDLFHGTVPSLGSGAKARFFFGWSGAWRGAKDFFGAGVTFVPAPQPWKTQSMRAYKTLF